MKKKNINRNLIQKGFEKWSAGTADFFELLSDDVNWTITGNSPISKTYTSKRQFLEEAIEPLNKRLAKTIKPTVTGLYAEGNMVIALWIGKAMAKDGTPYNNTYSWYMKIKKSKITEVTAFFDTVSLSLLWERVRP
ncbi:nuclear transport factor 2 family protein [Chryseolinea sp. T2]|uniref:nuclear transport factor 2 family protein n=1 Tax=Chryseolinea sp. T2 TaxID=3129255 RepID=UPI003076CD9E